MKKDRTKRGWARRGTALEEVDSVELARESEQLLAALVPQVKGARFLCSTAGRAQLAVAAAQAEPTRSVVVPLLDLHLAERARETIARLPAELSSRIAIECIVDWPAGPFDAAFIPLRAGTDSEVAWELLQSAFLALEPGGVLYAAVDEPRDHWVGGRMEALFGKKVARHPSLAAIAYSGVKRVALKKVKSFDESFAFRDGGRLIHAMSRPGVFSHRRLDLGARALIESLEEIDEKSGKVYRKWVKPGQRILDLGCGSGAVGLAAALRADDVLIHAVDSMPRAVACTLRGAELNGLAARFTGQAVADGMVDGAGTFDLVLANPPYYSHHKISEVFARAALRAVKPGGRVHFVTKQPEWFLERLGPSFPDLRTKTLRTYSIVAGTRR